MRGDLLAFGADPIFVAAFAAVGGIAAPAAPSAPKQPSVTVKAPKIPHIHVHLPKAPKPPKPPKVRKIKTPKLPKAPKATTSTKSSGNAQAKTLWAGVQDKLTSAPTYLHTKDINKLVKQGGQGGQAALSKLGQEMKRSIMLGLQAWASQNGSISNPSITTNNQLDASRSEIWHLAGDVGYAKKLSEAYAKVFSPMTVQQKINATYSSAIDYFNMMTQVPGGLANIMPSNIPQTAQGYLNYLFGPGNKTGWNSTNGYGYVDGQ